MQFKYFEIEKIILCTLACIQISSTQKPRCSTFAMNFFGSLHEDRAKPLWEIEKESIGMVMHTCFPRCERDQQCVGVEICTIRPDLSRCRGCCEWYVIDKDGGLPRNATDGCKYFELSKDSVESRGTRLSANSNLTAVASSTLELTNNNLVSNVLDGIPDCNISNVYSSNFEPNPWLEVTLPGTITIWRIIIYNGVYGIGVGLVNLNVTYSNNDVTNICGFYPGLLSHEGDLVSFYCPPKARATTVKMQVQSKPGQLNFLFSCEVEIYRKG
ncbi:uncharacterized protein LOC128162528 [Crassostrea angulata]|uniref:uncharacterized protein LOC128162528 n=1 Tax=Magallana angulata TaxID=2784310 RepID=UPI0022B116EC|nr:uncharacterized protein LOC128162528 [Crassostrea angulata]